MIPEVLVDYFQGFIDSFSIFRRLYALVGEEFRPFYGTEPRAVAPTATEEGYRLYYAFPSLFASPEEAERALKWWFGSSRISRDA